MENDENATESGDCTRSSVGQSIGFLKGCDTSQSGLIAQNPASEPDNDPQQTPATGGEGVSVQPSGASRGVRRRHDYSPRACAHCETVFVPKRHKSGPGHTNSYCSRRCAAHAPRLTTSFRTPDSTKAERTRANGLINSRLKDGKIVRPPECSYCFKPCKPDSHHPDYSRPALAVWLCRSCHMRAHNDATFEKAVAEKAIIVGGELCAEFSRRGAAQRRSGRAPR